ncbi:MAG: tetratricopeptide repeat protein [Cyanobacteria bacterium J06560_6]
MSEQDAQSWERQNRVALRRLILTVEANSQSLELLIAVCDDRNLQAKVIEQYEAELREKGIAPFRVRLNPKEPSMRRSVTELMAQEPRLRSGEPAVVTVLNAEALLGVTLGEEKSEQERFFFSLQWTREALLRFEFAVVLWVPEGIAKRIGQRAPDFWSWRGGVFEFGTGDRHENGESGRSSNVVAVDVRKSRQAGNSVEGLLTQVRELEKTSSESALLMTLYNDLGEAHEERYAYSEALVWYEKALALAEKKESLEGQARALRKVGDILQFNGRSADAIQYYERGLEVVRGIDDCRGEAAFLGNLGNAYHFLNQYQQAINFYQQALEIAQKIGDRQGEAKPLGNLGNTYDSLNQSQKAINFHHQALEIAQEVRDRAREATSLSGLGNAYNGLTQYQKAADLHQQALDVFRELSNRQGEAASFGNLGSAYYSLGQYQRAIDFHRHQLEISREIGDRRGEANSQFNNGLTSVKLEQNEAARTALQEARQLYAEMELSDMVKRCDQELQSLDE